MKSLLQVGWWPKYDKPNHKIGIQDCYCLLYMFCSDVARILSFFLIRQVPGEYVYIRIYIYIYIPYHIFRYQNDIICFHITSYHDTSHTNIELPKILNPQLGVRLELLELKAVDQSIWCLVDWKMEHPTYINISTTQLQMSLPLKKPALFKRDLAVAPKKIS